MVFHSPLLNPLRVEIVQDRLDDVVFGSFGVYLQNIDVFVQIFQVTTDIDTRNFADVSPCVAVLLD